MSYEIITDAELRRSMKAPAAGKYLLFGDEDYLKSNLIENVRRLICPDDSFKLFNCVAMDRAAYSAGALRSALLPPPMFADCKLVSVSLTFEDLRQNEIGELIDLLGEEELFDYNLLILSVPAGGIDCGTPKRPSSLMKKLCEVITPVRFDEVGGARLRDWIIRHYSANGVNAVPAVAALTAEWCGESMLTLASEIDKVSYYVLADGRTEVKEADVRFVASRGGSYDAFAFANAILARRSAEALLVLMDMKARRIDPVMVMGELSRVLCDMYTVSECLADGMNASAIAAETGLREYPVKLYSAAVAKLPPGAVGEALRAANEADMAVKSSSFDYLPIERFICSL